MEAGGFFVFCVLGIPPAIILSMACVPGSRRPLARLGTITALAYALFAVILVTGGTDVLIPEMGAYTIVFVIFVGGAIFLVSVVTAILGFAWRAPGERREERTQSRKQQWRREKYRTRVVRWGQAMAPAIEFGCEW